MAYSFNLPSNLDPSVGVPVTYWLIMGVNFDVVGTGVAVYVNGYFNQAAFQAGKAPVTAQMQVQVPASVYSQYLASGTTVAYPIGSNQGTLLSQCLRALQQAILLGVPFFAGATIGT